MLEGENSDTIKEQKHFFDILSRLKEQDPELSEEISELETEVISFHDNYKRYIENFREEIGNIVSEAKLQTTALLSSIGLASFSSYQLYNAFVDQMSMAAQNGEFFATAILGSAVGMAFSVSSAVSLIESDMEYQMTNDLKDVIDHNHDRQEGEISEKIRNLI